MNNDIRFDWADGLYQDDDMDTPHCNHTWKEYLGFTDHYWFCIKCDKKVMEKPKNDGNSYLPWWARGSN